MQSNVTHGEVSSDLNPAIRTAVIAGLNDAFRQGRASGRIVMTHGVHAEGELFALHALRTVQAFTDFTPDNDPHGEHDFGSFEIAGEKLFWKIDYYDRSLEYGSDNPADPSVTTRVLTIMLASEY